MAATAKKFLHGPAPCRSFSIEILSSRSGKGALPAGYAVAWAGQFEYLKRAGARLLRVQPKAMTVAVIVAGLVPIMAGSGTGSEVMQRIAAPMVGGMITAPLLSLFVVPAAFLLLRRREMRRIGAAGAVQPTGASGRAG